MTMPPHRPPHLPPHLPSQLPPHSPLRLPGNHLPRRCQATSTGALQRRFCGFSIVELLVVIVIISILIGLVVVGMQGVRNAGARTQTLSSLRQIMAGYSAYMADNRQHLLPGYVHPHHIGTGGKDKLDLRVRLATIGGGQHGYLEAEDTAGYVWRLMPYLDNAWQTLMTDYRNRSLTSLMSSRLEGDQIFGPESNTYDDLISIGEAPSFGLNSIFVGGDTSHGGSEVTDRHPWLHGGVVDFSRVRRECDRLAAVRFTEVRNPSQLIVFGPTARAGAASDFEPYAAPQNNSHLGYVELRPPYVMPEGSDCNWSSWTGQQWRIAAASDTKGGGEIEAGDELDFGGGSIGAGLPIARWGRMEYPVANMDGSTTLENLGVLSQDMRRWSPFVTGMDPPAISGP